MSLTPESDVKRPAVPFEATVVVAWVAACVFLYRSFGPASPAAFGPNWEQVNVARSLVAGHGFSNPFGEAFPTGPTAVVAPVHPAMLAVIFVLFGNGPGTAIAAVLLEVTIQVAALVLLLRISLAAFSSWIPGAVAAAAMLFIAWPLPQWENGSSWLAMEAIFLWALLGRKTVWTGMVLGVGWLVSPALIPASLAAVAALRGWKYTRTSGAIAALVVAPWMVRNWITFHEPIFLRDGFGLELLVSNNDRAEANHEGETESFYLVHPTRNASRMAKLMHTGEPRYFRGLQTEATEWIRTNLSRFLQLTGTRIGLWWTSTWLIAAVNLLALIGIWLYRAHPMARAAAAGLVLYPVPYYVVQYDPRYAWPVVWMAALMAGHACLMAIRRLEPWRA